MMNWNEFRLMLSHDEWKSAGYRHKIMAMCGRCNGCVTYNVCVLQEWDWLGLWLLPCQPAIAVLVSNSEVLHVSVFPPDSFHSWRRWTPELSDRLWWNQRWMCAFVLFLCTSFSPLLWSAPPRVTSQSVTSPEHRADQHSEQHSSLPPYTHTHTL